MRQLLQVKWLAAMWLCFVGAGQAQVACMAVAAPAGQLCGLALVLEKAVVDPETGAAAVVVV